MYDALNEPHEFVGGSREDATERACKFFGVGVDALTIHELRDVYGLGGRTVIVAVPRNRAPVARGGDRGERSDRGDRGERGDRGDRGDRGRPRGDRGGRGGDGPRRDRGDRERGGERGSGRRSEALADDEIGQARRDVAPAAPAEPSIGSPRGEIGEVTRYVLGVIERMELGPFQIGEQAEDQLVVIDITGPAAAALAAGDGRPVDALQLLANQAASRGETEGPRIVLEVEGDAETRENLLARLAERAAKRARETRRAIALDPMNGRDRRLIHVALRDESDVVTMSIGEGRYRQVVVVPEGAPEYEQARRESAAAAQRSDG